MQRKVKFIIAYDGTDYHGWQRQKDDISVQEVMENIARRVIGQRINLVGASRTDSGVHARGQVAHILYEGPIPAENLRKAINHRLPNDINIVSASQVSLDFHATRGAIRKLYRYRIHNAYDRPADISTKRQQWHVYYHLDEIRMRHAAARIIGTHDFAAFASQGNPRKSTVRTVNHISVYRRFQEVIIDVQGDGFLYNQVRNMVGTLVEIGRGYWEPERASDILASCDRAQAGPTAPPEGLCLQWIQYPPNMEVTDGSE